VRTTERGGAASEEALTGSGVSFFEIYMLPLLNVLTLPSEVLSPAVVWLPVNIGAAARRDYAI
jgi:hypothetical protein